MEKKNLDWANLSFGYMKTDKRFVSNYKNGAWDEGTITEDDKIVIDEKSFRTVVGILCGSINLDLITKELNGLIENE